MLGSRGFDVPKLSQKLETLNAAKNLEAIEPAWETDIEVGLLKSVYYDVLYRCAMTVWLVNLFNQPCVQMFSMYIAFGY